MKVCLLLSGLLRNNSSFASLNNFILSKYSCDVYCHSWYNGSQDKQTSEHIITQSYNPVKLIMQPHLNANNNFVSDYYPQLQTLHTYPDEHRGRLTNQNFSQLLGLKVVSELVDVSQYDFIIRARYDKTRILTFPDLNSLDVNRFYASCSYNSWFSTHPLLFSDYLFIMSNNMLPVISSFDLLFDAEFCKSMYAFAIEQWGRYWDNYFWPELMFAYMIKYSGYSSKFTKLTQPEFSYVTR